MELIRQEVPLNVDSASQDATKLMGKVVASAYQVANLNASEFVMNDGKEVKLASKQLDDRPEHISFFRFLYNLDPASINHRIKQKPTFFSFCLRLPQHRYYKTEDRVEMIYSPVSSSKLKG